MKKILITLVILIAAMMSGQAQDKLKIGELKSGKLVITNLEGLKAYLMNSLNNSGTLGKDYQLSSAPEGDRCLIHYAVTGNASKVSAIGVMLVKEKNDFFIISNPAMIESSIPGGSGSLEIQCIGDDCSSCLPEIKWINGTWIPYVICKCMAPGGGTCNMISKVIIKIEI